MRCPSPNKSKAALKCCTCTQRDDGVSSHRFFIGYFHPGPFESSGRPRVFESGGLHGELVEKTEVAITDKRKCDNELDESLEVIPMAKRLRRDYPASIQILR